MNQINKQHIFHAVVNLNLIVKNVIQIEGWIKNCVNLVQQFNEMCARKLYL